MAKKTQNFTLKMIVLISQVFVASLCVLWVVLFAAMIIDGQARSPSNLIETDCTEDITNFPWCLPPKAELAHEDGRPISEQRRTNLRKVLLRAFPTTESYRRLDPSTDMTRDTRSELALRQAESFSCSTIGPTALLQERAAVTYERLKPNCLVPANLEVSSSRPTAANFASYWCGAPDWCPDNGRRRPVGVKLPPQDHAPTQCAGRPHRDLREIMSQKTCDNASLIKWSKEGDRMAKFVFWTRANDNPNYKKDPSVASISHEQALAWLVQAALPAEILDPLRASCSNTGSGVRDAACHNFGNPEAQIELAAVIARSTPRTKGWEALSRELVYFASANGQPDAADQVGQLYVEKQP